MRSGNLTPERDEERDRDPGGASRRRPRFGGDAVAGAVMLVFALAYLAVAFTIPESSFGDVAVGPRAVPFAIGLALAAASVGLLVKGLWGAAEEVSEDDAPPQAPGKLAVVAALLLGYILVFVPLGYALSTFLFVMAATTYLERGRWVRNLVYAVVFSVVVYSIFVYVFGVQLPAGVLGV